MTSWDRRRFLTTAGAGLGALGIGPAAVSAETGNLELDWTATFDGEIAEWVGELDRGYRVVSRAGFQTHVTELSEDGRVRDSASTGGGANDAVFTSDGGTLAAGYDGTSSNYYGRVVKFRSDGSVDWERRWDDQTNSSLFTISRRGDGGYLAAGWRDASSGYVGWLLALDEQGGVNWSRTIPGGSGDSVVNAALSAGNRYYVGGATAIGTDDERDFLWSVAADGSQNWSTSYGTKRIMAIESIDTEYAVAADNDSRATVLLVDRNGNAEGIESFAYGDSFISQLAPAGDGGILFTGGIDDGNRDIWFGKVTEDVNAAWEHRFGGTSDDDGDAVLRASDGSVLVAGGEGDSYSGGDSWMAKLSPPNEPPRAVFSLPEGSVEVGESVRLDAGDSTDPDGTITRYEWDVDGDGEYEREGERVSISYDQRGNYDVTLRVTDDRGVSTTRMRSIEVIDPFTADDVELVGFSNEFASGSAREWLGTLLGATEEDIAFGGGDPVDQQVYSSVELLVEVANPERFSGDLAIRPLFDGDGTTAAPEATLQRVDDGSYAGRFRFRGEGEVGSLLLQSLGFTTTAANAEGDSSVEDLVSERWEEAVSESEDGYPPVTLSGFEVGLPDGSTETFETDHEMPSFVDACPEAELLQFVSDACGGVAEPFENGRSALVLSPASIAFRDGQGRVTGRIRGDSGMEIREEIPDAVYSGPVDHEFVLAPEDDYDLILTGTENGEADLRVDRVTTEENDPEADRIQSRVYTEIEMDDDVVVEGATDDSVLELLEDGDEEAELSPDGEALFDAGSYVSSASGPELSTYENSGGAGRMMPTSDLPLGPIGGGIAVLGLGAGVGYKLLQDDDEPTEPTQSGGFGREQSGIGSTEESATGPGGTGSSRGGADHAESGSGTGDDEFAGTGPTDESAAGAAAGGIGDADRSDGTGPADDKPTDDGRGTADSGPARSADPSREPGSVGGSAGTREQGVTGDAGSSGDGFGEGTVGDGPPGDGSTAGGSTDDAPIGGGADDGFAGSGSDETDVAETETDDVFVDEDTGDGAVASGDEAGGDGAVASGDEAGGDGSIASGNEATDDGSVAAGDEAAGDEDDEDDDGDVPDAWKNDGDSW